MFLVDSRIAGSFVAIVSTFPFVGKSRVPAFLDAEQQFEGRPYFIGLLLWLPKIFSRLRVESFHVLGPGPFIAKGVADGGLESKCTRRETMNHAIQEPGLKRHTDRRADRKRSFLVFFQQ